MSVQADRQELTPARRRRRIALGLLRALATTVVLVVLYYLLALGLVVRAFVGAVQFARQQAAPAAGPDSPPGQARQ
jgi:hypothetical protein